MANVDVKQLLSPTGTEIQVAVQGTRIAGRVAVAVYWEEIETALESGVPVAAIYRVLHKAGLVSVTRQAFTRQVKARREVERGSAAAAKPATDPRSSTATVAADAAPGLEASAPVEPDRFEPGEKRSGIPHRPWRTGPREAPDPTKLFKPRDPLADD